MSKKIWIAIFFITIYSYNVKSEEAFYPEVTFSRFRNQDSSQDYFFHTIERGQTVYSIAKMYGVTEDDIYQLNPGADTGIQADKQLKIPQKSGSYLYHTIQPKETLYSVSKNYYMQGEDIIEANPGLSVATFTIGKIIRIPTNKVTTPPDEENETYNKLLTNTLLNQSKTGEEIRTVKVALLLPFRLNEGITPENAGNDRMVEYYEGFLLALEDLKKQGISVNLQVYDTGLKTDMIPSILEKETMKEVNLIIGGLTAEQIKSISRFAQSNNIPYVIPVTSNSEEPLNNFSVFQINTPQSYLYSKASDAFCNQYQHSNIVFYISDSDKNKLDFIRLLQKDLTSRNISYQVITDNRYLSSEIRRSLDDSKNNVFVPSDDTAETFELLAALRTVKETEPNTSLSLFGYPAWQAYASDVSADFSLLNTAFFSVYYANPTSPKVKAFYGRYARWYGRELISIYPKYGLLGYDTGMFFIQLLNRYGTAYAAHVNEMNYSGIQTDFHFERANNWGGFINTNLYFVEFNPDFTINAKQIK
ncbi:MAG: LysM peptidoglycan-binding domain-containing protein [Dysgonamonadaceae bacterium]|jgi:LysM repeat protein/ABC-type branched-subunit amino acid transport system substrate-binding protein|nr:LysM peptidoglycan-binding domain-containing protein [Dysgonamonadaceae bacterium]